MVKKSYIVEDSTENNKFVGDEVEKKCNSELYQKFGFLLDQKFYEKKKKNPKLNQKKGYSEIEISGERIGQKNKKITLTNKNDENKMIVEDLESKEIRETWIEGEDVEIFFKNDIPSISKFNYKTMEYDWTNCDDVFERMDRIILRYI